MARNTQGVHRPNELTLNKIFKYKLVLLGESGVGKTAIVLRFSKEIFYKYNEPTVGSAFSTQTVQVNDRTIKFDVWDTAGQEVYRSILPLYYRDADAAIVVYDIQKQDSFDYAKTWVNELRDRVSSDLVIALAGNKADLVNNRTVDCEEAKQYAKENGLIFMETSAKTAVNVNEIFLAIAKKLPKKETAVNKNTIQLTANKSPEKSKSWCGC